jgi:hypothetical protein
MPSGRRKLLAWVLAAACGLGAAGSRAEDAPLEYQVKAAFLYNFAKFVEWPEGSFAKTGDPIVIGVLGDNPFGRTLDNSVAGKTVDERPLMVRYFSSADKIEPCHILYVSLSERRRLGTVIEALKNKHTLTVGETNDFTAGGGIIGFTLEEGKVRFEINSAASQRAGLKISSKLLKLATTVRER